jgi:hypothetical protein
MTHGSFLLRLWGNLGAAYDAVELAPYPIWGESNLPVIVSNLFGKCEKRPFAIFNFQPSTKSREEA